VAVEWKSKVNLKLGTVAEMFVECIYLDL